MKLDLTPEQLAMKTAIEKLQGETLSKFEELFKTALAHNLSVTDYAYACAQVLANVCINFPRPATFLISTYGFAAGELDLLQAKLAPIMNDNPPTETTH